MEEWNGTGIELMNYYSSLIVYIVKLLENSPGLINRENSFQLSLVYFLFCFSRFNFLSKFYFPMVGYSTQFNLKFNFNGDLLCVVLGIEYLFELVSNLKLLTNLSFFPVCYLVKARLKMVGS